MEAKIKWKIKSGADIDHLWPRAALTDTKVKRGAKVDDTVKFIPEVVEKTLWQTEKIAPLLKGKTEYETCENIWYFVKTHFNYHRDREGLEDIRSPRRSWKDRFVGIDCDCMTVLVCSLMINCGLSPKKIILRITKYSKNYFQHIYPIVLTGNGSYITMDCVVDRFNYEEPYSEKEDNMDLQFLDGIDDELDDELGDELGKSKKKEARQQKKAEKKEARKEKKEEKKAQRQAEGKPKGKLLNVLNKVNPATVALRNGLLAAMKLNALKIAGRIKWAYLPEGEVEKRGIDINKWRKLQQVKTKLEEIFYKAGGKPENLKKAILTGKGNRNNEVRGWMLWIFY